MPRQPPKNIYRNHAQFVQSRCHHCVDCTNLNLVLLSTRSCKISCRLDRLFPMIFVWPSSPWLALSMYPQLLALLPGTAALFSASLPNSKALVQQLSYINTGNYEVPNGNLAWLRLLYISSSYVSLYPLTCQQFIRGLVEHRPDIYLDKIQALVERRCGVEVSEPTIWRVLSRAGLTMKKVSMACLFISLTLLIILERRT